MAIETQKGLYANNRARAYNNYYDDAIVDFKNLINN